MAGLLAFGGEAASTFDDRQARDRQLQGEDDKALRKSILDKSKLVQTDIDTNLKELEARSVMLQSQLEAAKTDEERKSILSSAQGLFSDPFTNAMSASTKAQELSQATGQSLKVMSPSMIQARLETINMKLRGPTKSQIETKQAVDKQNAIRESKLDAIENSDLSKADKQRAIKNELGARDTEFFRILDEIKDPSTPPDTKAILQQRLSKMTESEGFAIDVDKDGNVNIRKGAGAGSLPKVTAGKLDEIRANLDTVNNGVQITERMINAINTDPTRFALVGTARKGAETAGGIVKDMANASFELAGIDVKSAFEQINKAIDLDTSDDDVKSKLRPTTAGEVEVFEAFLTYSVARALKPEGRMFSDTIETARQLTEMTGIKSSQRVKEKMETLQIILKRAQNDFQRRLEQSVQGTATTPKTSFDNTDIDSEVNRILDL